MRLFLILILTDCRHRPVGYRAQGATSKERQASQHVSSFHRYTNGIGRGDCAGLCKYIAVDYRLFLKWNHNRSDEAGRSSLTHRTVLMGCASVLNTCVLRSRVSGDVNSKYRYFIVSARKKLSMASRFVFVSTFFKPA